MLLIPIAVSNANRINIANVEQATAQYAQQQEQAAVIEQRLNEAEPSELASFLASQGQPTEGRTPNEVKETVLSELALDRQQAKSQFELTKAERQRDLLSDALKWSVGAVISGILFIYLWVLTGRCRESVRPQPNKSKKQFR